MSRLPGGAAAESIGGASQSSGVTPRPGNVTDILRERMEIIKPEDIQLAKFLGAGGYGEVKPWNLHVCVAQTSVVGRSDFCLAK